jgi:hypothetical protein
MTLRLGQLIPHKVPRGQLAAAAPPERREENEKPYPVYIIKLNIKSGLYKYILLYKPESQNGERRRDCLMEPE